MATIMTTAEIALELDTTPRTLRKFLRSADSGIDSVGKGARYQIERKHMRSLTKRFNAWQAANAKPEATDEVDAPDAPADDA